MSRGDRCGMRVMSETRPLKPGSFERRVLLATVGLNPQVVTETLYALATDVGDAFAATEVHLVTTEEGAVKIREALLGPSGMMAALALDIGQPALEHALAPDRIHVIRSAAGKPLADINTAVDQDATADLITSLVRELTNDAGAALHGSIAGGRKTMGFLLGYALTLFARPQDRVSHVLVNAPFETHPQFFFPPRQPRQLQLRDGTSIGTDQARIMLADVPFVRLRESLPREIRDGRLSHSETVRQAQAAVPEPTLVIDHARRTVACNGIAVTLPAKQFAVYAWLARRRAKGKGGAHWWNADPRELLREYGQIADVSDGARERQRSNLEKGIPTADFETSKSRVNSALTARLGRMAKPYLIETLGPNPGNAQYSLSGLLLPPEAISFGEVPLHEGEASDADEPGG